MKEIEFDLGRESLLLMIDGQRINADAGSKEDRIIAAISIDDDPQVERLDCWSHKLAPGAELSDLRFIRIFRIRKSPDKCWYLGWKNSQGEDTKVCIF